MKEGCDVWCQVHQGSARRRAVTADYQQAPPWSLEIPCDLASCLPQELAPLAPSNLGASESQKTQKGIPSLLSIHPRDILGRTVRRESIFISLLL
jgi:hypothetical protein